MVVTKRFFGFLFYWANEGVDPDVIIMCGGRRGHVDPWGSWEGSSTPAGSPIGGMWEIGLETGRDGDANEVTLILYVSDTPASLGLGGPTSSPPPSLGLPIQGKWDNIPKSPGWLVAKGADWTPGVAMLWWGRWLQTWKTKLDGG
jgi:hypothetical protein